MKKIYLFCLLALATLGLASCSDSDDTVAKTPLEAPTLVSSQATVSSLAFAWSEVPGATQYAYELYNAAGKLVTGGIDTKTSKTFTGLADNTAYTLKVWAYGAVTGDKSESPTLELTATTPAITPLDKPGLEAEPGNGTATISWAAVDNADFYTYSYQLDGETITGTTTKTSVTLRNLPTGDYTLTVTAGTNAEAFTASEPASITFGVVSRSELWRKAGKYYAANLGQYFDATIVAYSDGTYTIESPYGEKGYSLSFSTNDDGTISFTNASPNSSGYYSIWANSSYYLYAYTAIWGGKYSAFEEGSGKDKGEVWFFTYLYDASNNQIGEYGYDDFVWGDEEEPGLTADDLAGTYSAADTGWDLTGDWTNWVAVDQTTTVTITKNDDGTLNIYNLYGWEENFTASVDLEAKTITIEPCQWSWFTFCKEDQPTEAVVGTFDDNLTITFSGYTAYYTDYSYSYLSSMKSVLTKQ